MSNKQKRQIKTITNQKQRRHSISPNFVPAVLMNSSSSKISKLSSDLRNLKLGREGVELLLPLEPPPSPEGWALLAPSINKLFKTTTKNAVSQPYESIIKIKEKGKYFNNNKFDSKIYTVLSSDRFEHKYCFLTIALFYGSLMSYGLIIATK